MIRTRSFRRAHPLITSLVATVAIALGVAGGALVAQDDARPPAPAETAAPASGPSIYAKAVGETTGGAIFTDAAYWDAIGQLSLAYEAEQARQRELAARATTTASGRSTGNCAGVLACIRACESHGDYGAVSSGGTYRGAYQFDQQTWESVGGSGDPASAPPEEQDTRAGILYDQRGSGPWPRCG